MGYWKQWKRIWTKCRRLIEYGIPRPKAWEYAKTRKGYWRISSSAILARMLTNQLLKENAVSPLADSTNALKYVCKL